ncbi:TPA: hypothetical protein QC096_004964 [Bacillus thuringiensis]|nr:hypothetical protein [Bacillus thuringiensis]
MDVFEYLDHVNSKEDLLEFRIYLQKDFKMNKDEWEPECIVERIEDVIEKVKGSLK